ncbi:MAG: methyltransferase domain-containing protein [Rhodovibrionaceae bacterium]|nr:methyltransferase domain-containing protein [Rhodovibrionaceae bacterium]
MTRRSTLSSEERAQRERFDALYLRACSPVMLAIEKSVCGCDYGGNSWTTRAEADGMISSLGLQSGTRLLDLGAGAGWPGLYMAQSSGCDVTLVDLPFNGLKVAADRICRDGLSDRARAVVASAAELPFPPESFDAVTHSDLLCCLVPKRAVLAACRAAVRGTGRMVFTVISVAPDLSPARYRRAVSNGPVFIETDTPYPALLRETGWQLEQREDITAAYTESCRRQLAIDEAQEADLSALLGADEFAERIAGWRSKLAVLKEGLLRRELFAATPAAAGPDTAWEDTTLPAC